MISAKQFLMSDRYSSSRRIKTLRLREHGLANFRFSRRVKAGARIVTGWLSAPSRSSKSRPRSGMPSVRR